MNEKAPPDNTPPDDRAIVQSQDLEHQPTPETCVPNKGVKVQPPLLDRPNRRDVEAGG